MLEAPGALASAPPAPQPHLLEMDAGHPGRSILGREALSGWGLLWPTAPLREEKRKHLGGRGATSPARIKAGLHQGRPTLSSPGDRWGAHPRAAGGSGTTGESNPWGKRLLQGNGLDGARRVRLQRHGGVVCMPKSFSLPTLQKHGL